MSQFDFGTINPDTKTGSALANDLNEWRNTLHSLHRGSFRPKYAVAGTLWLNSANAKVWYLKLFDGAADITIGTLDIVAKKLKVAAHSHSFAEITAKPATYPPSPHSHKAKDIDLSAITQRLAALEAKTQHMSATATKTVFAKPTHGTDFIIGG